MKFSIVCLFLISFFNLNLKSQDSTKLTNKANGILTGRVVNAITKAPIPSMTIRIIGTNLGAITDQSGKYTIKKIPVGVYNVKFSCLGYLETIKSDISIGSGRPTTLEVDILENSVKTNEIEVKADAFETNVDAITSTQILTFEEIRRAPGVQEDVVKATALLPGVNRSGQRNDLLVRGGAPFENLYIVDNIELQNINHFGSQGSTGGPLSIIDIDFVKEVEFSAGAFGAKYGDKLSSITNITLRSGNEEKFAGKVNLSATGLGANIEGPLSENGSYFLSVRKSYLDIVFSALGLAFIPQYWDFQGKVNYRLDDINTISILGIGVLDDVKLNNKELDDKYSNSQITVPEQKQFYVGATWKHVFEKAFSSVTIANTNTNYKTFQNDSNLTRIFQNYSIENEIILKAEVDWELNNSNQLLIGNQIKYGSDLSFDVLIPGYLRLDQNSIPQSLKVDSSFNSIKNSTYFNLATTIDDLKIVLGSRLEYINFTKDNLFFSPRLSLNYGLSKKTNLILSAGRYFQSPSYIWMIGTENQKLNPLQADQIVLGVNSILKEDLKIQIESYYKKYTNYTARIFRPQAVLSPTGFDDVSKDIPFGLEPLNNDGEGYSRGFEIFLQKKLSEIPCYGLMSFSYSETNFKGLEKVERPGTFDSRIIFNLGGGYRFTNDWELSSKFRFSSGLPTTPFKQDGTYDFTQFNLGERFPDFYSLDIRVDKKWVFEGYFLTTYIDIENITGRKNVTSYRWDYREKRVIQNKSIGIFPTIGISVDF